LIRNLAIRNFIEMKTIEVEIDEHEYAELNLSSNHISFDELQRKMALKKFISATRQMREAAKKNGLDNLNEEEIFEVVKQEKKMMR
jgi:Glu-tRNA(Gln) amidotransferase subunit E-like FAD-binding protein